MLINPNVIRIIRQNLNWIIIALFFFLFGIFLAAFALGNEDFFLTELTKSQQDLLAEMAEMIFAGPPLKGIAILFLNNLLVSLQMMIFGFFLGITPLIGLFTNGALLGSIIAGLEYQGASALVFLSLGVLPHGIFELPAFIISAAFGLKLGFHLLFPLPQKKRGESFKYIWREFISVLPLIICLFLIAAIVEITLTPLLLKWAFPTPLS